MSKTTLLDLPPEIRNNIYTHHFNTHVTLQITHQKCPKSRAKNFIKDLAPFKITGQPSLSLLQTNKLIHAEASATLHHLTWSICMPNNHIELITDCGQALMSAFPSWLYPRITTLNLTITHCDITRYNDDDDNLFQGSASVLQHIDLRQFHLLKGFHLDVDVVLRFFNMGGSMSWQEGFAIHSSRTLLNHSLHFAQTNVIGCSGGEERMKDIEFTAATYFSDGVPGNDVWKFKFKLSFNDNLLLSWAPVGKWRRVKSTDEWTPVDLVVL